jgi:hypothetical protein
VTAVRPIANRSRRAPQSLRYFDPFAADIPDAPNAIALRSQGGGGDPMKDVVFVAITAAFFFVSWLYVHACDKLSGGK